MFGFLYGLLTLFGSGYEHIRRADVTRYNKKECVEKMSKGENPCGVYYDWRGFGRDIYTDKKVIVYRENGHTIVKEVNGPILRDITQEGNNKEIKHAIQNGAKVIKVFDNINDTAECKGIISEWERRTGKKWRMTDDQPKFDTSDAVYVHCGTKRYCVIRSIKFSKVINKDYKKIELVKGAKDWIVKYYVDIHNGEVLDRVSDNKPKIEENNKLREMTAEEEKAGIDKYFQLIKEGEVRICIGSIGWKHALAEVLPIYCEEEVFK